MQGSSNSRASTIVESFVSKALVVPVTVAAMSNTSRLNVHKNFPEKLQQLRKSAEDCLRPLGQVDRTGDLVDGILNNKLSHDLWYMCLANGPTIILVKEDIYSQISEREIAEQVHKSEVESAAQRGEHVPEDLLLYYRSKSRPSFTHADM